MRIVHISKFWVDPRCPLGGWAALPKIQKHEADVVKVVSRIRMLSRTQRLRISYNFRFIGAQIRDELDGKPIKPSPSGR